MKKNTRVWSLANILIVAFSGAVVAGPVFVGAPVSAPVQPVVPVPVSALPVTVPGLNVSGLRIDGASLLAQPSLAVSGIPVSRMPASLTSRSLPAAPGLGSRAVPAGAAFSMPHEALPSQPGARGLSERLSAVVENLQSLSEDAGRTSAETAWSEAGKFFEAGARAKKDFSGAMVVQNGVARKGQAKTGVAESLPRPSRTLNNSGKTETTKGKLPIHRPVDEGSSYEPGLYSNSRLGEFEWDKEEYGYHWVLRVKRGLPKGIEAFMGGITHQAMEQLYMWMQGGKTMEQITLDDLLEVYNTYWEEQLDLTKYKLGKGYTIDDYRRRGENYIRGYWERFFPFNQGKLLFLERKLRFTVEDTANGKKYRFQGIPDRVTLFGDVIEISDYKTTLNPPTQEQLREKDYQLALYVWALQQNFPDLVKGKKFRLTWNYKEVSQSIEVTDEYMEDVRARVLKTLHEIEVFTEQVEANRDEWMSRLDPQRPPKKMKDAQKLVDKWTRISWEKEKLEKELKKLEAEEESIIEKLLLFAKKTGNTVIPGRMRDAVLKEGESVKAPTKSGDAVKYAELARIIKEAGLWEAFSSLDMAEVKKLAKVAGHPHHELYKKIKHLVSIALKQDLKLQDKEAPESSKKKKK